MPREGCFVNILNMIKKLKQPKLKSNNISTDVAAAAALWECLKGEDNLTPRNVTQILTKHGFSVDTGSGSSHFNVQPPESLSELGSFTLTPSLNQYLLQKMLERNFERFFDQFMTQEKRQPESQPQPGAKQKGKGKEKWKVAQPKQEQQQPESQSKAAYSEENRSNAQTVIARAYRYFAKKKKYNLFKKIKETLNESEDDKEQMKRSLEKLEQELLFYPDMLPIIYFAWLELFETIDESIPVMKKLVGLCNHPIIQNSESLKESIPIFIYYHYADHIKRLMDKLESETLDPVEHYCAIETCVTLHLHILSMLSPPIQLCDPLYPVPTFNYVDPEWYYNITLAANSFISGSTQLFMNIFNKDKPLEGAQYTFKPMKIESSSSSSSTNQGEYKSVKDLTKQTTKYVTSQIKDLPKSNVQIDFDWYILAYTLAKAKVYQNNLLVTGMNELYTRAKEISLWESAIALFEYSKGSFENLGKITTPEEVRSEIFYLKVILAKIFSDNNDIDRAYQVFIKALQDPVIIDVKSGIKDNAILELIGKISASLMGYYINHIEENDNINSLFKINEFLSIHCNIFTELNRDKFEKIMNPLNKAAQNIKLLGLKLNKNEQTVVGTFMKECETFLPNKDKGKGKNRSNNDSERFLITPAMKDFQALMVKNKWEINDLKKQAEEKRKALMEELEKEFNKAESSKKKKNK